MSIPKEMFYDVFGQRRTLKLVESRDPEGPRRGHIEWLCLDQSLKYLLEIKLDAWMWLGEPRPEYTSLIEITVYSPEREQTQRSLGKGVTPDVAIGNAELKLQHTILALASIANLTAGHR